MTDRIAASVTAAVMALLALTAVVMVCRACQPILPADGDTPVQPAGPIHITTPPDPNGWMR